MKRKTSLFLAVVLVIIVVASALAIYGTIAFNPEGSKILWQRSIADFATGLAADGDLVFAMNISGYVNCYNAQTGESVWSSGNSVGGYFAKGLTVAEGRVYGGFRYASVGSLDEATGQFQWNQMYTAGINNAPDVLTVKEGRLFVVSKGPGAGVAALNASTGTILWQTAYRFDIFGNITDSKNWWLAGYPLNGNFAEGKIIYAIGGNTSYPHILKLDTTDGSVLWQSDSITFLSLPTVVGTFQGQIIIVNGNQILSLSQTTGEKLWMTEINATAIYAPTPYLERLFFVGSDGNFYSLNPKDGAIISTTKVDDQKTLSQTNADLTLFPIQVNKNQRIYLGFGLNEENQFKATIVCLDFDTCNLEWTKQIQDTNLSPEGGYGLIISKDTVFLTENNTLWIFNASTGNQARNERFEHYVLPPIMLNDKVFLAADLQLTAYQ
ncbi:MAG: PQQ-binding-like beta-propeller repeat protein [Betaproteobacteria bacterium]